MKKVILMFAALAAMVSFTNCTKDGEEDGKDEKKEVVRLAKFTFPWAPELEWSEGVYCYSYNTDGKVAKVTVKNPAGETKEDYTLTYSGTTVTITNLAGATAFTITLGENGYAAKMADEWDENTYSYDAAGHMIQVKRGEHVTSDLKIENGNIMTWTGADEVPATSFRTKAQTYSAEILNLGQIHSNFAEKKTMLSAWLMHTGLFGKACDYVCLTSQWTDSETGAVYEYEYDANGYVTVENKIYGGTPEISKFEWEVVK